MHRPMKARGLCSLGLAAALALWACERPPAPALPGRDRIGPPPEAAASCEPPFPMSFGEAWFLVADLDRGSVCTAFLEQDECVVGLFRDCSDLGPGTPREWQGRFTDRRELNLVALDPDETGARPARAPRCCVGPVGPEGPIPSFAVLECQLEGCGAPRDARHAGLYLERLEPASAPPLAPLRTLDVVSPLAAPVPGLAPTMALLPERDELWVATARRPGGEPAGLHVVAVSSATPVRLDVALGGPRAMAVAADEGTVFVADEEAVLAIDAAGRRERRRLDLGAEITALVAARERLWVATASSGAALLQAFSVSDLAPGPALALEAPVTGLVSLGADGAVALTLQGKSELMQVDAAGAVGSTLPLDDFRELDLEGLLPRSLTALGGARVGFVARCGAGVERAECFFEADLSGRELTRTGVPGVGSLLGVAASGSDEVWIGSDDGVLTPLPTRPRRPWLQGRVAAGVAAGSLALDGARGRLYVLDPSRARVTVLERR
jgi:hypothetical protein